jgi:asparagine synthase (glutamine-hydrolysing)
MCGIAGRFNFRSGAPASEDVVARMCELIAHRGPDGHGVYVNGPVGLGHRRLAIIDLSEQGRQPMASADGRFWISFNGEIYNFLELRERFERQGYRFQSHTDTEVILAAYQAHGVECLDLLRGMFAFAIWDGQDRTLFMARDRIGKKPLYYRVDDDGISFASEPKAFLAESGFDPRPNLRAIARYLSYQYVPSPDSAFEGVERLRPAHYLLVKNGALDLRRYWRLTYQPKRNITEEAACEELLAELREATRLRMISDVPLGAFLSGGVDSSAIVALMAEHSAGPVKTFSIGFEEKAYDELDYARLVAKRYGTDHHEFVVRPNAVEIFDKLVWHYNEPFADSSAIPTYYLAELTRRHVTVALNGDAGDENFAGYNRYALHGTAALYERLPRSVRQALGALTRPVAATPGGVGLWSRTRRTMQRGATSPDRRYVNDLMQFDADLRAELFTPEFARTADTADTADLLLDEFRASDAADHIDAMLAVDVNWYLPDALLVKVDIATMAHSLEGRSPLVDHRFMEFAARLPSSFKRRGSISKYIFKQALRPLLPAEIIDRPKKGFAVPLDHWFRHELRELAHDTLLDSTSTARGYFRPATVARLLDEHARGVRPWHEQLWNLLMLELWHRRFIDDTTGRVDGALTPQVSTMAPVGSRRAG